MNERRLRNKEGLEANTKLLIAVCLCLLCKYVCTPASVEVIRLLKTSAFILKLSVSSG